jgi:hypothetical protein
MIVFRFTCRYLSGIRESENSAMADFIG